MPRSRMLHALRQLMQDYRFAARTGRPIDEVHEERAAWRAARREEISRRRFLAGAGAMAAAASLPMNLGCSGGGGGGVSYVPIAIIGGGMAGLAAGIRLKDAQVKATIFESQARVGGRLLTDRTKNPATSCGLCHSGSMGGGETGWLDNQYVDVFGELIDSLPRWADTWGLAGRYWSVDPADPDCVMLDMFKDYPAGATDTYFFDNDYYPWDQVVADFKPVYEAVVADEASAPYPTTWENANDEHGEARQALDNMSIHDWIETRVPGGHGSRMGKLLDAEYNIEYGAETTGQSAFNLIYLLAYQPDENSFSVYGESDEKWKLKGGIDRLTSAMADELSGWGTEIRLEWALRRITQAADGSYYLDFDNGQRVRAGYVLMALPFSALRAHIDFEAAGFDEFKRNTILQAAVGHNYKAALQFTSRFWNQPGPWGISNGNLSSDLGCQYGWDGTRGLPGTAGILIHYAGGKVCDGMALSHPYGNQGDAHALADAATFLGHLATIFPGVPVETLWTGKVAATKSHLDPNYLCGYGSYAPGGYTRWCGAERLRSNNVLFAGEHTSIEFFGYFEGAAAEARGAAETILSEL